MATKQEQYEELARLVDAAQAAAKVVQEFADKHNLATPYVSASPIEDDEEWYESEEEWDESSC